MKKIIGLILVSAAVVIAGCVPSINPLYTDKDLVYEPNLVGNWAEPNGKESWSFEKAEDKKYKLVYTDEDGHDAEFEAALVRLKDENYLDLVVTDIRNKSLNHLATASLIPGHLILKLSPITKTLRIAIMNPDKVKELVEKDPKEMPFKKTNDALFLTGTTKELQAFVIKHNQPGEIFGDLKEAMELVKK